MAHQPIKLDEERVRIDAIAPRLIVPAVALGVLGFAVSAGLGLTGGADLREHFFFSYLVAFIYFLGLSLGGLFFVMLHHVTRAGWSVVLRRMAEGIASNVVLMIVLFLPVLAGLHLLYRWTDPATHIAEAGPWRDGKSTYLSVPWFVVRMAVYFAAWTGLALYFKSRSIRQDTTGDVKLTMGMQRVSARGCSCSP